MASDPAGAVPAAVAGGTLTDDTARAILACIDADGCIDAPNDLLERTAREVIEAAGLEFRLAKRPDPPATHRENEPNTPQTGSPRRRSGPKGPRFGLFPRLSEVPEAPQGSKTGTGGP